MRTKLTLFVLIFVAAALSGDAQDRGKRNRSTSIDNGNRQVTACGDIRISYDRRPAITEETTMTIPSSQVSTLQARSSNSGIYVHGWDRNEYSVTTCKAIPEDVSRDTLGLITTTNSNGLISVNGPSDREWMANLIISVPRITKLDMQTSNGPLQLRDMAGEIRLNAANGPVHLSNVGGSVQVTTANGPIHVEGSSGDHRISATNGPVHIALSGSSWDGPGFEATTRNGPLTLSVPPSYNSGIRIEAPERSPVSCRASVCSQASRSLNAGGIIRIGNGDPRVRLSTQNGPLSIQDAR
jgi:DUF4097 and DUF4098 domain-containing protein YvlB